MHQKTTQYVEGDDRPKIADVRSVINRWTATVDGDLIRNKRSESLHFHSQRIEQLNFFHIKAS